MYWKTKNGEKIDIRDLSDFHLEKILRWIEEEAKNGQTVVYGDGYTEEEVKEKHNYYKLKVVLLERKLRFYESK